MSETFEPRVRRISWSAAGPLAGLGRGALPRAAFLLAATALAAVLVPAQTPANAPAASFTATTDNVSGGHDSIRINLLRWSTDAERDQLLAAWNLTGPATGARRGGRGAAPIDVNDPALAEVFGGRGAGGRGGRGGRGGGRGDAAAAPRPTPEASLAAALGNAPTVGYLWSSEVAGYSLRYAVRLAEPDGGERIILITDRRLGAWNDLWKPVGAAANAPPASYEFSVIELRLNPKGEGEGKVSLSGKAAVDPGAKTIALENYSALPVILKGVKRRSS